MAIAIPQLLKAPRTPFTKPAPGTPINWAHPFARHLVHSYPFNEGKGDQVKNYVWPRGQYDLGFRLPNTADTPRWGTFAKVPGLEIDIDQTNPLSHITNTGTTNPSLTGHLLLPCIDFSRGFTVHLWMRPTESLVGVVTAYNLFNIGPVNEAVHVVVMIHLTRFASGPTDWWRRNITIYSDGTLNTNVTSSDEVWEAPLSGGRVKIDSLPYQHVISVNANSPAAEIKWYSSDGYNFGFAGIGAITPPDGHQYWPLTSVSGQPPFEGQIWGWNVYNRPMGFYSAMQLMSNPLGMYAPEPSNGRSILSAPGDPSGGGNDPGGGGGGGGLLGDVDLCSLIT